MVEADANVSSSSGHEKNTNERHSLTKERKRSLREVSVPSPSDERHTQVRPPATYKHNKPLTDVSVISPRDEQHPKLPQVTNTHNPSMMEVRQTVECDALQTTNCCNDIQMTRCKHHLPQPTRGKATLNTNASVDVYTSSFKKKPIKVRPTLTQEHKSMTEVSVSSPSDEKHTKVRPPVTQENNKPLMEVCVSSPSDEKDSKVVLPQVTINHKRSMMDVSETSESDVLQANCSNHIQIPSYNPLFPRPKRRKITLSVTNEHNQPPLMAVNLTSPSDGKHTQLRPPVIYIHNRPFMEVNVTSPTYGKHMTENPLVINTHDQMLLESSPIQDCNESYEAYKLEGEPYCSEDSIQYEDDDEVIYVGTTYHSDNMDEAQTNNSNYDGGDDVEVEDVDDVLDDSVNDPDYNPSSTGTDSDSDDFQQDDVEKKLGVDAVRSSANKVTIQNDLDSNHTMSSTSKCESNEALQSKIAQHDSMPNKSANTSNSNCQSKIWKQHTLHFCQRASITHKNLETREAKQENHDASSVINTVIVKETKPTVNGKRVWDRKHFCYFCNMELGNLYRHFERKHYTEIQVQEALSWPKNSSERIAKFRKLKNLGNYQHNYTVQESGVGTIVTVKRPSPQMVRPSGDFLPCNTCLGYFSKTFLWRHKKTCTGVSKDEKEGKIAGRRAHQRSSSLLIPVAPATSSRIKHEIIAKMKQDDITLKARTDDLIMKCANRYFEKNANQPTVRPQISEKIRALGRFLIQIQQLDDSIHNLNDCIKPCKFSTVVEAVKQVSGYNKETSIFSTPSLSIKLGHTLKMCAEIVKSEGIQSGISVDEERGQKFLDLYAMDWDSKISGQANRTLHARTFNKPRLLPLTKDILKFNKILYDVVKTNMENLKKGQSVTESWSNLCKAMLARIIIFNRRREGEVSRMLQSTYKKNKDQTNLQNNTDVTDSLSSLEKKLCHQLTRIEIRGKRGRRVPILLTPTMKKALDLLCDKRTEAGIPEDSKYMFAVPASLEHQRGDRCLRMYAHKCGAENPGSLTSTNLRKHIATTSQILNLSENEMDVVANFMGHNIRIHKDYYRLSNATMELAKVSRLLLSLERGTTSQFQGKNLDDIETDVYVEEEDTNHCGLGEQMTSQEEIIEEKGDQQKATETEVTQSHQEDAACIISNTNMKARRPKTHTKWTPQEVRALRCSLHKCFLEHRVPSKAECVKVIKENEVLKHRSWQKVKDHVRNWIVKQQKQ